ncbi:MAG TPA: hypothetical protein VFA19_07085 [Gaiellaceae bacterium]|nr:hypothetical protein [Gaiellaceae bacterium]
MSSEAEHDAITFLLRLEPASQFEVPRRREEALQVEADIQRVGPQKVWRRRTRRGGGR